MAAESAWDGSRVEGGRCAGCRDAQTAQTLRRPGAQSLGRAGVSSQHPVPGIPFLLWLEAVGSQTAMLFKLQAGLGWGTRGPTALSRAASMLQASVSSPARAITSTWLNRNTLGAALISLSTPHTPHLTPAASAAPLRRQLRRQLRRLWLWTGRCALRSRRYLAGGQAFPGSLRATGRHFPLLNLWDSCSISTLAAQSRNLIYASWWAGRGLNCAAHPSHPAPTTPGGRRDILNAGRGR